MRTSVLLSIKPLFVDLIFAGHKRFEFRRTIFKSATVSRVVVYASRPVQRVVGEFTVGEILELDPQELWKRTRKHSGIAKDRFYQYFKGRETGFAITINKPFQYRRPLHLGKVCDAIYPPQSFMYLEE